MKTKNILLLTVVAVCVSLALLGCSRRDLSTPSSRLVGHWQSPDGDYDQYFGPIDKDTRIGTFVEVDKDGNATYYRYKVTGEDLDGEEFEIASEGDGSYSVPLLYWISKDGLRLSFFAEAEDANRYIDNKTEP